MKKLTFILLAFLIMAMIVAKISANVVKDSGREIKYDSVEHKTTLIMDKAKTFLDEGKGDKAEAAYITVITDFPTSPAAETALRSLADYNEGKGDLKTAVNYYRRLIKDFPHITDLTDIRKKIDLFNMEMIKSTLKPADSAEHVVVSGDTLYDLAKKFNTTVNLIKKTNDLKTDVLQIGQKLKISTARFSVKVDKAKNVMELKRDGELFKTYVVATGRDNSTPVGVFKVTDKMVQPVWTKPGVGMVMPDSEDYELGARWIPISAEGYGIHGTNDESSIGAQTTAGCVRMYNSDVIELYDIIPVGTEVEIIDSALEVVPSVGGEDKNSGENDGDNT